MMDYLPVSIGFRILGDVSDIYYREGGGDLGKPVINWLLYGIR